MESISIKVLNEVLSASTRRNYLLNEQKGHTGIADDSEGEQGEYNETFEYFKHPEMPENCFLQITYQTDSYGHDKKMTEMKFVKGVAKQVTVYEPI